VLQELPTHGFAFQLHHLDAGSAARRGTLTTPHGPVETPAFMPVATQGTVKGLEIEQVRATQAEMVLCNTYHLTLRPGYELIWRLGGLHAFTGWDGPILTDSGGFQIYSLADRTEITEEAARFRSHIDGHLVELTPEGVMRIQQRLGSDIAMVLDHVVALPSCHEAVQDACFRTLRWAERARQTTVPGQAQFGIVQGGLCDDLRRQCAQRLIRLDFDGYAVGGLSVGEKPADMYRVLQTVCPMLPVDRPRYLMGVGRPVDMLEAIRRGIDLFDCVMPTRNGRNALAFTDSGVLRLRNLCHQTDERPLEQDCPCAACRRSRAYIRHLFQAGEMLGPILLSIHNLTYYQRLLSRARQAIEQNRLEAFYLQRMSAWGMPVDPPPQGHSN
jgi:queuine tRNA-ribosyltransferase